MPSMSVGGLVSGLDTATIISQLMQLEARPQTSLKSRVTGEQRAVTALQGLNSKLASLATKSAGLAQAAGWAPTKATSSETTVTATTAGSATPGAVSFQVLAVAKAYAASYATTAPSATPVVTPGSTFQLQYADGRPALTTLDTGDGSLSAVAKALNASGTGVTATLVSVDGTNYRLQVTSTTTGAGSGFTLTGADGTTPLLGGVFSSTAASDARIQVTGETATISSTTNTFTGVMPGVDVTVSAATPLNQAVTVTVDRDVQALSDSLKAMVTSVNDVLTEIGTLTAYDAATKKAGPLVGDSALRGLRDELLRSVSDASGGTLATYGVQLDRYGKLVFDEAKFEAAYAADPAAAMTRFTGTATWTGTQGTASLQSSTWRTVPGSYAVDAVGNTLGTSPATRSGSLLSGAVDTPVEGLTLTVSADAQGTVVYAQGLAAKLEAIGQRASDAYEGSLSLSIQNRQSQIKGWEDDIADWDTRLASRREALQRQYTALEAALGKLQSQGSWLAGQIGSLPKMSQ